MHNTLYLTTEEQHMLQSLPNDLQEGWNIEIVSLVMEDDRTIAVRAHMAQFDNPEMQKAAEALATATSSGDFERIANMVRFDEFEPEQLGELFFALGVKTMTGFVGYLLLSAQSDEAIEGVAYISSIRKLLSETNSEPTV